MKNPLILIIAAAILTGCGGLHVSWLATASYNATAVTQMESTHDGEAKK